MKAKLMLLALALSTAGYCGDTPFFRFQCNISRPSINKSILVEFKNDDNMEQVQWKAELGTAAITFTKENNKSMEVQVVTGPFIVAQTTPAEYHFSASLEADEFHFRSGISPIMSGPMFRLECQKVQQ